MRMTRVALLLLWVGSSGCTGSKPGPDAGTTPTATAEPPQPTATAPEPTSTAVEPTTTTVPTMTAAPSGPNTDVVGNWVSASCGKRTYAREISLGKDGNFGARDLVSPCPPKAMCVWSGIVERSGKWAMKESTVLLTVEKGADAKQGQPLSSQLPFNGGVLSEDGCAYQRK